MKEELWYIDIGYACFGVVTRGNCIVEVPPIAKWLKGKNVHRLKEYVKGKNGTLKVIN